MGQFKEFNLLNKLTLINNYSMHVFLMTDDDIINKQSY